MALSKERPSPDRKATPKPDTARPEKAAVSKQAAAPRRRTSEQKQAPLGTSNLRAGDSPQELRRQIEEAAYYRAAQRGFQPGYELEDWIQAESEVLRNTGR